MKCEDNSVNIEMADGGKAERAGAYHHGDLRAAVIAAGMKRLAANDGEELRLRALARDVGVSATALYRHFPDREALLDALADEGLRQLGARQSDAWRKAGGGKAGFLATGVAYVRFAHDAPAVFRLSFTRRMPTRGGGGPDGGETAFDLLRLGVAQAMPHIDAPDVAALHAWALVHGLAMLILDGRIEWDAKRVENIVGMTFGGIA